MKLKYFAWVAEIIEKREEEIELPDYVKTIDDLMNWLSDKNDGYRIAFNDKKKIKYAINQTLSKEYDSISRNDEVAFFPPMTGG
tara:strand:+ start:504 stop:755 length:252 start_codon:yes stop_codon:yes gene_type:complete